MVDIARQPVLAPRIPWRSISLAIVLIALLLAAVAAFIGAQPRLPAPFGLARNGLIAYDAGGDIYTADPVTGTATAIVSGPETDGAPHYSRDGTRIVFQRQVGNGLGQLYVVALTGATSRWSPPSRSPLAASQMNWAALRVLAGWRSVLFASGEKGYPSISIAQSDGSGVRQLDVGSAAYEPSFRPPDGAEILFVGGPLGSWRSLYAVDVASGTTRTIHEPMAPFDLAGASWSPGWIPDRVPGVDKRKGDHGSHPRHRSGRKRRSHVPSPPDAVWHASAEWSNDGTRLFIIRGYSSMFEDVRPAVVPADGSGSASISHIQARSTGSVAPNCEWSPDDSRVLDHAYERVGVGQQQVIIDLRDRRNQAGTVEIDQRSDLATPGPLTHRHRGRAMPLNLLDDTDAIPCRARPPWPCRTRGDRGPARADRTSAARRT